MVEWGDAPPPEDPGVLADDFTEQTDHNSNHNVMDPGQGIGQNISQVGQDISPRDQSLENTDQVSGTGTRDEGPGAGAGGTLAGLNNPPASDPELNQPPASDPAATIAAQVAARVQAEAADLAASASGKNSLPASLPPGTPRPVPDSFVAECINANELGDGMLFAALHRDNYIYNKSANDWLSWAGHYWQADIRQKALAAVEDVSERYLNASAALNSEISKVATAVAIAAGGGDDNSKNKAEMESGDDFKNLRGLQSQRKKYIKRVEKLRSVNGRQACLNFARTNRQSLDLEGFELDQKPMLLACENGVIDLESGRFKPGRQQDLISKAVPIDWAGYDAPAPLFRQTISEIFDGNLAIISFVQRLIGYSCTGLVTEHIFPVFQGRGRNGKSLLLEIIREVLGPLAAPIRPELLLEQAKNRSAAAPSPDTMALRGLRLAIAEETDEGDKFSASRVKQLTGGTELTGRNPNDKYETTFKPTHHLFLCTNNRPKAPSSDYAFWRRMRLVEFKLSFVDNPQAEHERPVNKDLAAQILATEKPGILAWIVAGCIEWRRDGLNPPDEVMAATHQYQRDEDLVGDFLDECMQIDTLLSVKATPVYNLFTSWYMVTQGRNVPSQKWFGKQIGIRFDRRKSNGVYKYFGLDINFAAASEYTGGKGDNFGK